MSEFADSLEMVGGQVGGVIDLGFGDDIPVSGDRSDIVQDNAGNASDDPGAGNDVFGVSPDQSLTNANDSVDSGAGVDTLDRPGFRRIRTAASSAPPTAASLSVWKRGRCLPRAWTPPTRSAPMSS